MIEYRQDDLLAADAEALVNAVNCVGVMGKGIALQFKQEFPENFQVYKEACRAGEMRIGKMLIVPINRPTGARYIVNFPTKQHWRGKSTLIGIEQGLADLVEEIKQRGIKSIAIPPLGCGNGGLDWADVRPLIEAAFTPLTDARALVYEPRGD